MFPFHCTQVELHDMGLRRTGLSTNLLCKLHRALTATGMRKGTPGGDSLVRSKNIRQSRLVQQVNLPYATKRLFRLERCQASLARS
jgi:hypothetical protein